MLDLTTLNDVFALVAGRGDETVAQWQSGGEWKPITGKQFFGRVGWFAENVVILGI